MKWAWAFIFMILISGGKPVGQDYSVEPDIRFLENWKLHRSLGVVMTYQTADGRIQFAHPIMNFVDAPECREIVKNKGVWNMMSFGENPVRYFVASFSTAKRIPPGEWETTIQKTYGK